MTVASAPDLASNGAVTITLSGIAAFGHHGVFAHERVDGQRFVVDLECSVHRPAAGDALATTVDYGALAQGVADEITGAPVDLIETLAERIASRCLADPMIRRVLVRVHKPQAPMPVDVADVCVTITRSKP